MRKFGRVVKALDLSPSGHSPRGFEPRSMQCDTPFFPSTTTGGVVTDQGWVWNLAHPRACTGIVGVAGVMVSIVAFQAVDPGSIPGPRTSFFFPFVFLFIKKINKKCSPAGNRTRVLWVKATYPNQLDYRGGR